MREVTGILHINFGFHFWQLSGWIFETIMMSIFFYSVVLWFKIFWSYIKNNQLAKLSLKSYPRDWNFPKKSCQKSYTRFGGNLSFWFLSGKGKKNMLTVRKSPQKFFFFFDALSLRIFLTENGGLKHFWLWRVNNKGIFIPSFIPM